VKNYERYVYTLSSQGRYTPENNRIVPDKTVSGMTPRDFLFFVMGMETKYVWDIAVQNKYSKKKRELADQVSHMISSGGSVKEMQIKMRQLNIL